MTNKTDMTPLRQLLAEATPGWQTVHTIQIGDQCYHIDSPEAIEHLSHLCDDSFGSSDHAPMWAWTQQYVIVEAVYEGSTWFQPIPLLPGLTDKHQPEFIGGQ